MFPYPRPDRFALYVHIPFCVRKCPYCAFVSQELRDPAYADEVVTTILKEASCYAEREPWKSSSAHSLFLGGGTPSLLGPATVKRLIAGLRERFNFTEDAECSIEVNPGTLHDDLLDAWSEAGFNRVSLGVQSLGENTLKTLGRIHSADQARKSWQKLRESGSFQLNVDLMYSVQTNHAMEEWRKTLDEVASWSPDHLSAYALIVEKGTPFAEMEASGKQVRLDEDEELQQMHSLSGSMRQVGLEHYEVSNWATSGCRCVHNTSYWDGGSYLSLGPAAHSYDASERRRFWNLEDTRDWMDAVSINGNGVGGEEILTLRQHLEERIMLTLRMVHGGPENELEQLATLAGLLWHNESLEVLLSTSLVERKQGMLRCTERGFYLVDEIQAQLAAGLG